MASKKRKKKKPVSPGAQAPKQAEIETSSVMDSAAEAQNLYDVEETSVSQQLTDDLSDASQFSPASETTEVAEKDNSAADETEKPAPKRRRKRSSSRSSQRNGEEEKTDTTKTAKSKSRRKKKNASEQSKKPTQPLEERPTSADETEKQPSKPDQAIYELPEETQMDESEPVAIPQQTEQPEAIPETETAQEPQESIEPENPQPENEDDSSSRPAAYYDISETDQTSDENLPNQDDRQTVFNVDEEEDNQEGPRESQIQYDVSVDEEEKKESDHYDNTFFLDEPAEKKNWLTHTLSTIAAFFSALVTRAGTVIRKAGSWIASLPPFKKKIPESPALHFNDKGQIIAKQIIDADGNKIDLQQPETLTKLPLFTRIRLAFSNWLNKKKEARELRRKEREAKQAAALLAGEPVRKPLSQRFREFIASLKEKLQRRKQPQGEPVAESEQEEEEETDPQTLRQLRWRKLANGVMGVIVFFILLGASSGLSTIAVILNKTDVVLDIEDIHNQDSTRIFDDQGEQIAIVGAESRISVSYASFPQVVVDAFVAIEDSRFFEHPGFDVPRFAKAFLENIRTLSFAQGGSTLTMQVIKNTYFAVDTIADKGIDRKVQEIYYSLKINNIVSKEKIFELYVNKVNFGQTARGIQVASQYYFGKDCTDLSLVEAAMLAGLVQAPNSNNPYYHLEESTKRTHEVLYQMRNHGYITEEEYRYACAIPIQNILVGTPEYKYGQGETVDNQAYIDIVLAELQDVYDINPNRTPVRVYTAMNQTVQTYMDEVSRGNVIAFPDEHINTTLVCIRNNTGELVGVSAGRDYDGKMMFNYAYDNRINPGSTSKGVFTYPMAFEHVPLATNHYIFDEPIYWTWTRIRIGEEHGYAGDVSTQRAFTTSYNVVAVKLFQWVVQEKGMEVMQEYLKSIDIDSKVVERMNEQYAIGMQNFMVSPIQLCAAESVILSHGVYNRPHTITRIEFIDGDREPIEVSTEGKQVLSEGAAWLTRYLQEVSVNANGNADDWQVNGRLQYIKHKDYTVYGKTGTGLFDKNIIKKYKWPDSATKDFLMVGGTNDYSFSFWIGYDTGRFMDRTTYVSQNFKNSRPDGRLVNGLLDSLVDAFGKPVTNNPMPEEVTTIRHIKGIYPYLRSGAIKAPAANSYILKKHVNDKTFTSKFTYKIPTKLENLKNFTASYTLSSSQMNFTWANYPIAEATQSGRSVRIVFDGHSYILKRKFDTSLITGVVQYCAAVTNNSTGETQIVTSSSSKSAITLVNTTGSPITYTVVGYYGYSKRENLVSNKITVTVTVPSQQIEPDPTPTPVEP